MDAEVVVMNRLSLSFEHKKKILYELNKLKQQTKNDLQLLGKIVKINIANFILS